jgi:hypothetical protein
MKQHMNHNGKMGVLPPTESNPATRFRKLIQSEPVLTCPFIGLKHDAATLNNFASGDNFCHCKGRPASVPLDHQQMFCLFGYARCPSFLRQMVAEVQASEPVERSPNEHLPQLAVGMVGLLTALLGIK